MFTYNTTIFFHIHISVISRIKAVPYRPDKKISGCHLFALLYMLLGLAIRVGDHELSSSSLKISNADNKRRQYSFPTRVGITTRIDTWKEGLSQ
jgi:hypothetical protein